MLLLSLAGSGLAGPLAVGSDLHADLAKPLSAGSVAILIDHRDAPAVHERWAQALRNPLPEVRAAAARVVHATGTLELVPDVARALEAEQHVGAASEGFMALAALGGPRWDEALFAAARRLGGSERGLPEYWLGVRGPEALRLLPRMKDLSLDRREWREFLTLATRGEPWALSRAGAAALNDETAPPWGAVLDAARATGGEVDEAVLVASLGMKAGNLREQTCWHLARTREGEPLSAELRLAIDAAEAAAREAEDLDTRFACEILQRVLGREPIEDRAWIESMERGGRSGVPRDFALLRQLTPLERKAAGWQKGKDETWSDPSLVDMHRWAGTPRTTRRPGATGNQEQGVRLLDLTTFPEGFVTDVLRVTGCKAFRRVILGGAKIDYGEDGGAHRVTPINLEVFDKCSEAARIFVTCALQSMARARRRATSELLLLRLDRHYLGCVAEAGPSRHGSDLEPEQVAAGRVPEPKVIRRVAPVYPESARMKGERGLVLLDAAISATGCVKGLEVVTSPHLGLGVAALRAVSEWRYAPTVLDDDPVPVRITVMVIFQRP